MISPIGYTSGDFCGSVRENCRNCRLERCFSVLPESIGLASAGFSNLNVFRASFPVACSQNWKRAFFAGNRQDVQVPITTHLRVFHDRADIGKQRLHVSAAYVSTRPIWPADVRCPRRIRTARHDGCSAVKWDSLPSRKYLRPCSTG